ncbi:hypothetical protein AM500_22515 [Bacillus sp. FJAT-18017]|uniref:hypothetical protein n=1 Tax=Bacillus sp. FJAT-18017 TaxID=1705566 RepID=UPI0006AE4C90|nr:hypothetical protein [Bacillus sp. FJAT-18017]ALC92236.1 hypothetical protein AM500_22515 [Bacillus sp. FJAT-18017]
MTKKQPPKDVYEAIRNAGFKAEMQINQAILNSLNNGRLVSTAATLSKAHRKLKNLLQQPQTLFTQTTTHPSHTANKDAKPTTIKTTTQIASTRRRKRSKQSKAALLAQLNGLLENQTTPGRRQPL